MRGNDSGPILFPESQFKDYKRPDVVSEDHYHQWVDAYFGKKRTSMSFDLAGPLTESLLLGVVANRFPEQKLLWDTTAMKVKNVAEANALIRRDYRQGFEVERLTESASATSSLP